MATLPIFIAHIQAVRCCPSPYEARISGYPASPKTIGEHIRKHRLDLKIGQEAAAGSIGCDKTSVANWEKGRGQPGINHMAGVVRFLGFNPIPEGDSLAQRLVNHRKARGITQSQFASQIGVDPGTLARWERGERTPDLHQFQMLRKVQFSTP